jgi:predicted metalloprotease with PDZ domain
VLAIAAVSLSCAPGPTANAPRAVAPKGSPSTGWSYEVVAAPRGESLSIVVTFPPGTGTELTVGEGAEAFVYDVQAFKDHQRWLVTPSRGQWSIPICELGCRVSYRFALHEAASASRDRDVARMHGKDAVESPPSAWLLRPLDAMTGIPFRFHVTSAENDAFATGVFPVPSMPDTYEAHTAEAFDLPYAAFGRIRRMQLAGGHVEAAIFPGELHDEPAVVQWIERSAAAVDKFYGRFPIARVLVLVQPSAGKRTGFGTTMGFSGAAIEVPVGRDATTESLRDDWMLVHEMIHTALPDVTRAHHWLEEGIATYIEPLARVQAGLVTREQLWREWIVGMPQGEPQLGDEGLDRTHTWGRTYWGGALFCLEADVAIRERTAGKKSLADALRAIVEQGGNISVRWPVERVLDVGDAATGVPVLRETYDRMAMHPGAVDLPRLWSRLGVKLDGTSITFDDTAPLASIRRSMTEAAR